MIELREINDSNRNEVAALKVREEQEQFIASNEKSLETARENEKVARAFAICEGEVTVGFAMFAFDYDFEDPGDRFWLWRFMIDEKFQGKGFGKAALEVIIEYFRKNGADHIKLSTKGSNKKALALYHGFGFTETGEMNDGETVLKLNL